MEVLGIGRARAPKALALVGTEIYVLLCQDKEGWAWSGDLRLSPGLTELRNK